MASEETSQWPLDRGRHPDPARAAALLGAEGGERPGAQGRGQARPEGADPPRRLRDPDREAAHAQGQGHPAAGPGRQPAGEARLLDLVLRPHTPDEIGKVVKGARKGNTTLIKDVGESFLEELVERGLVEPVHDKVLGLFPRTRWRRTASGDAWAASAAEHVARLEALPGEAEHTPRRRRRAVAAAGALVLMVPAALAAVARLRRRLTPRRRRT